MNLTMLNLQEILSILVFGSILFVWVVATATSRTSSSPQPAQVVGADLGHLKLSFAIMLLNDNLEIVRLGALGIAILMIAALVTHLRLKSPRAIACSHPLHCFASARTSRFFVRNCCPRDERP